ncbi:MAG: hypothetical protein RIQ81_1650 [Pseudomonadota bacterium]|jgi:uncharacterized protein YndB with AHSA1/START domain
MVETGFKSAVDSHIKRKFSWFNSELDLFFERDVTLPPEKIWRAWTEPDLLMPWFCPKPWSVTACEIDLRPGGIFSTTMRSPEGQLFPNVGTFLEVVPYKKLVWTNCLAPGFRPVEPELPSAAGAGSFQFTGMIFLEQIAVGTRYTAAVVHGSKGHRDIHAGMGFEQGWGIALDQMIKFLQGRGSCIE